MTPDDGWAKQAGMIQFQLLDDGTRPAFLELLREPWQYDTWPKGLAPEVIEWRYFSRPNGTTWLAMDGDRCVASLDSMLRPYLLNGRRILVRETADWYCQPRFRMQMVGLRLLMHLNKQHEEPIFVLGGSDTNVGILSKMPNWCLLPMAASFAFPLKARDLAASLLRRRGWRHRSLLRLIPDFLPARLPRAIKPPVGDVLVNQLDRHDVLQLPYPECGGMSQLVEHDHWAWLGQMPRDLATPIGLTFYRNDQWVGFSLSQIEPTRIGRDGRIMYLQAVEDHLYSWVIAETTRRLAEEGVGWIRACVSTPSKIAAMKQVGYLKIADLTCHWWPSVSLQAIDVGYLRIDDSLPFQALWERTVLAR